MKHTKDEREFDYTSLKTENDQLKEELEKQKRALKECQRQLTVFREMKEKYDSMKSTEKSVIEERQ
jgi:hypothetical protein